MATKKPQPAGEPATHAVMTRTDPETGEVQRVEVDIASGSVEVMEALGWTQEA